jgi:RNA polymerase sigma-70 factor (ECF subfamily)
MTRDDLAELIQAHQAELYRYVKYLGADHATAEDLVQEGFVRAFRAKLVPAIDNIPARRAWLRRIVHNLFIDHCRRRQRSPVYFDSESVEHAEALWTQKFLPHDEGFGVLEALEDCLGQLPDRQRSMVDSFYARRHSREQMAGEFKISPNGVKMALRRIRAALGECIERKLASHA